MKKTHLDQFIPQKFCENEILKLLRRWKILVGEKWHVCNWTNIWTDIWILSLKYTLKKHIFVPAQYIRRYIDKFLYFLRCHEWCSLERLCLFSIYDWLGRWIPSVDWLTTKALFSWGDNNNSKYIYFADIYPKKIKQNSWALPKVMAAIHPCLGFNDVQLNSVNICKIWILYCKSTPNFRANWMKSTRKKKKQKKKNVKIV